MTLEYAPSNSPHTDYEAWMSKRVETVKTNVDSQRLLHALDVPTSLLRRRVVFEHPNQDEENWRINLLVIVETYFPQILPIFENILTISGEEEQNNTFKVSEYIQLLEKTPKENKRSVVNQIAREIMQLCRQQIDFSNIIPNAEQLGLNDHGYNHIKTTWKKLLILNDLSQEKLEELDDNEILARIISCVLHDIGMLAGREEHAMTSVVMLEKIIPDIEQFPYLYERIAYLILNHESGNLKKVVEEMVANSDTGLAKLVLADELHIENRLSPLVNTNTDVFEMLYNNDAWVRIAHHTRNSYLLTKDNEIIWNIEMRIPPVRQNEHFRELFKRRSIFRQLAKDVREKVFTDLKHELLKKCMFVAFGTDKVKVSIKELSLFTSDEFYL